jgi:hypothetical protein
VLRFPSLLLCFFVIINCKGERLQVVEFLANGKEYKKEKHCGIKVDHWIT